MISNDVSPLELKYTGRSSLATLWGYFAGDRWKLGLAMVFFALKRMPIWTWPIFFGWVINIVSNPAQHKLWELWAVVGGVALLHLLNPPGHMIYISLVSKALRNMEARVRSALVRRLQQLSISFHDDAQSGRLQSKVLRDVEAIERLCRMSIRTIFGSMISLTIALVTAVYRSPMVAIFFLAACPLAVAIHFLFRRHVQRRNREFRSTIEHMSGVVAEVIDMVPVARAHGVEQEEISRVDDRLEDIRRKGYRLDITNALFNISGWSAFMGLRMACVALTGWMAWKGRLEPGDVVMFLGLFQMILGSVESFLYAYPMIATGMESLHSIGEVLECPDLEQNEGKLVVTQVEGRFEFRDVTFCYAGAGTPAVQNLSLLVEPNESIAVVGESGSGKSTLMSLIIGFYRPTSGQILLDGIDMQQMDLRSFRRHLAVVPQNTTLFSGSIRENIAYGMDNTTDEAVWQALRTANAEEFVRKLGDSLDTPIGENGVKLSGGQRQRLAIARAIIRRPKVIIFDEATSSLDVVAEAQVQEAIERLITGRTTFVVAHRLSTIRKCNRIVVMKAGRIVEVGSAQELLDRRGEFFRLKALQT